MSKILSKEVELDQERSSKVEADKKWREELETMDGNDPRYLKWLVDENRHQEILEIARRENSRREHGEKPSEAARNYLRNEVDPYSYTNPRPAQPRLFDDSLQIPPRRSGPTVDFPPPDFEDEHQMNRPRGNVMGIPGRSPLNIGHDDLNPPGLGPHDPLRPSFVGGGGLPGYGGGGGMHPTFDDPLFQGDRRSEGYDLRAPPGARYDPVGPGDMQPRGGIGVRDPLAGQPPMGRGGLGGPQQPWGTDDDLMGPGGFRGSPFGGGPGRGGFGSGGGGFGQGGFGGGGFGGGGII